MKESTKKASSESRFFYSICSAIGEFELLLATKYL